MKNALIAIALMALSFPLFPEESQDRGYIRISQDEAYRIMTEDKDAIILDVRTGAEFASGHIAGAINIPVESIAGPSVPGLPDKDAVILVYCRSGNRSRQASAKLAAMGYSDIREFGGINTWKHGITCTD